MNGDLLLRLTLTKTKNIAIGILLLFTLAIDDNCVRQDLQETSSSTETSFPPIEKCIHWPTNRLKNHQFYELDNKNTVPQIEEKTITQNRRVCMRWGVDARSHAGGSIKRLPPPRRGTIPIDGKYKTETAKKYYNNPRGARITKASHFNFQYVLGHKIVFLCVARGNPLPQITWFKDGVELYAHKYMQLHEWTRGHKLKSKMEIDPASQADAGIYECHANNMFAMDSRAFRTTYLAEFN